MFFVVQVVLVLTLQVTLIYNLLITIVFPTYFVISQL